MIILIMIRLLLITLRNIIVSWIFFEPHSILIINMLLITLNVYGLITISKIIILGLK